MDEDREALREQRARWIAAINGSDTAGFVAVVTEDAVWLPARHDALQGRDAIRAWLEAPFAALEYEYQVSEVRLRLAGAWAVEQANFITKAQTRSGEAMPPHEGDYTLLWRKTATGEWLIERYVDHSAEFVAEN